MDRSKRALLVGAAGLAAASVTASVTAPAAQAQTGREHPNIALVREYYAAYATGDPNALRPFLHPDIRWTIPGHHPLAGTKTGVTEVLAFFAELARAGFQAELIALAADGDWVIDLHRGWTTGIDLTWVLAFRIRGRRIVEAINFPGDQHVADAFFWGRYPLAPIPDRLA